MRDLNFFSSYIETKKTSKKKQGNILALGLVLALIIGGLTGYNLYKANELSAEITKVDTYLNSKEVLKKSAEVTEKRRKMGIMNSYYKEVVKANKEITDIDIVNGQLIKDISATAPAQLFLKAMVLTKDGIQMQGVSMERKYIGEFEHNLKNIEYLKDVHVNTIASETENGSNYVFSIMCKIQ